jgi:hypothetical protein
MVSMPWRTWLGQIAGALACQIELFDVCSDRVSGFQLGQNHFGVTENDRQQVVEIVSDAASQVAHRLHLLRLSQLLFEPFA